MKNYLKGFITAIIMMAACSFAETYFPKRQTSILKEGVQFLGLPDNNSNFPFSYGGKYGFTGKANSLTVVVEPVFDDIVSTDYALVPVKMNGKWGAFDASGKTLPSKQPAIPCIYDDVSPCDNNHVYAVMNGIRTKLDIKDYRE